MLRDFFRAYAAPAASKLVDTHRSTPIAEFCAMCGARTYGGKPYCQKHIDRMPLVSQILKNLQKRKYKGLEEDSVKENRKSKIAKLERLATMDVDAA